MPLNVLINNLISKVYPIHDIYNVNEEFTPGNIMTNDLTILPTTIANSFEKIEIDGIYLIDNSEYIYLYVLKEADPALIE